MNRFGSNSFDNENDQFAQNQRIGRQLAENNPRPWNGNNNPYQGPENRHQQHPNYRPDAPEDYRYEYQRPYGRRSGENPIMPNAPYDSSLRHHDDRIWTERNDYKDHDYRYRSGHRNYWHEDYDDRYENELHPRHRQHPESFFTHVGQGIRDGWNNLFHHSQHDERREEKREDERRRQEHERRVRNESSEWHNAGPDHRDEDFFDPKNYRW